MKLLEKLKSYLKTYSDDDEKAPIDESEVQNLSEEELIRIREEEQNIIECKVEFNLLKNGEVNVNMFWDLEQEQQSTDIGVLLYAINGGHLKDRVQHLLNLIRQQEGKSKFVDDILYQWEHMIHAEKQTHIKPSEVFKPIDHHNGN